MAQNLQLIERRREQGKMMFLWKKRETFVLYAFLTGIANGAVNFMSIGGILKKLNQLVDVYGVYFVSEQTGYPAERLYDAIAGDTSVTPLLESEINRLFNEAVKNGDVKDNV